MSSAAAPPPTTDDYWAQAKRPLAALLFLLPLLALYEFGILYYGGEQATTFRNGADCWMRGWLVWAGFMHPWLLPAAVVLLLGGWHLWERHPWRCSLDTLVGMFAESLLFAMGLIVIGQLLHMAFEQSAVAAMSVAAEPIVPPSATVRAVGYVGAGIYEEVMFRLALLPACLLLFGLVLPRKLSVVLAIGVTSLCFATAHYVEPAANELWIAAFPQAIGRVASGRPLWFSFAFRTIAGVTFALLFLRRGFGVTVGCHSLYDLLVGIVMQPPAE